MLTSTKTFYRKALARVARYAPRLASALDVPGRRARRWMIQHRGASRRLATAGVFVPDARATEEDVAIAARLLAAYRAAGTGDSPVRRAPDQWTIEYEQQGHIAALLRDGEPVELAAYLANVARHDATQGILQGRHEHERLSRDRLYRHHTLLATRDNLVSLAEALGAVPHENPEGWGGSSLLLRSDPAALVEAVERRLGIAIAPPDLDGGLFKLATSRGLFIDRDLWGIFTASLVRDALAGRVRARICEIGGGGGRLAYWAHRMGMTAYTVVDLPHASVVQGFYLLKALPAGDVVLYGEPGWEDALDRVRVLPAHAATTTAGHDYDLVVNQDSFPEMHPDVVEAYLAWIGHVCTGGLLLSINHEGKARYGRLMRPGERDLTQVCVRELVERSGGFQRLQRTPFWLRRGYVTEVYRVERRQAEMQELA